MGLLDSLFSSNDNPAPTQPAPVGYSPSDAVMGAFRQIESGGNPNAQTGSYKGLYQLSDSEFNRYGGQGSIFDPDENTRIARLKIADEGNQLAKALGRPVTDAEVYLAHQQGVGGATQHLSNPDQPAWQSMYNTAEGRQKGADWAKRAIWGNLPDSAKAQFGSVDNVKSGDFTNWWAQRYARAAGQPTPQAVAQNAPANSPSPANGIPTPPPAPPQPQSLFQRLFPTSVGSPAAPPVPLGAAPAAPQGGGQPSLMGQLQPPQMAPIQYYQRRPINLSALQGQLRPPILSQG